MNAKLCKTLRRAARKLTVGKPPRRLLANHRGMAVNDPNTTRGMYRNLKRVVP